MYIYADIAFRPMEPADLECVRLAHNDRSTLLQLGDPTFVSAEQQSDWFASMSRRTSNVTFVVCRHNDRTPIGVWRLQNVDAINRICEIGLDIFPAFRRQGFGFKTYRMFLSYLFDHYNIHTVYSRIAEFNSESLTLSARVGFRETGRIVESLFRQGRYWDHILMCMTVADYQRLYGGTPNE